MPSATTPPLNDDTASFTVAAEALDGILDRFRSETLPLEDALSLFETAVGHIKTCQSRLCVAKGKIEELVTSLHQDDDGSSTTTQPFSLVDRP
jgi:exodeoxyribonuclease VII small subunit